MAGRVKISVEEAEKEIMCVICHTPCTEPKVLPCTHYYCKCCIEDLSRTKGIDEPFSCPQCSEETTPSKEDAASLKVKQDLRKKMDILKKIKSDISPALDKVQNTKAEVEAQRYAKTEQIHGMFEEHQQILKYREQQLIKEVEDVEAKKLESLSNQEKKLSKSCADIESMIERTEQYSEHCADNKINADIQCQFDRVIAEQQCNQLHPVEEADIGVEVSFAEDLKQLCQIRAKVTTLATEVTTIGEGKLLAVVDETSELRVMAKLSNGKRRKCRLPLNCHLKSLASGSVTKCKLEESNIDNEYCIWYRPKVRGRHEIVMSAPGVEIPPFPLIVFPPPTQLVRPVREIKGFEERPTFVAVTPNGDVAVTEPHGVAVFSKDGVKLEYINNLPDLPHGVATDCAGFIYVPCRSAENHTSDLIKYTTPDLNQEKRSDNFDAAFRDISIIGNELFVCDASSARIMVFTMDLEFVRNFEVSNAAPREFGQYTTVGSVSGDSHGNLYVCVLKSSSSSYITVLVFSNGGQFLRPLANKSLCAPYYGLCVVGNYVYVTDYMNNDVSAYTTEGRHVISLKKHVSFNQPWGMCTDNDGFIYICDKFNKRVVVF